MRAQIAFPGLCRPARKYLFDGEGLSIGWPEIEP